MQAKYLAVSSIQSTMKATLIAYLSLCRPILEYADTLWDPTNKSACEEIEHVQNQAIRFIAKHKRRCEPMKRP